MFVLEKWIWNDVGTVLFKLSDVKRFTVFMQGDEHQAWAETESGNAYVIKRGTEEECRYFCKVLVD